MEANQARSLLAEAQSLQARMSEIRRTIHRHPELGMQEEKTAALIRSRLESLGIPYEANVGGMPAVVGLIRGAGPGPCVALRADMDALPLQERNQASYASQVANRMHACGHDGHVTALLGAAALLARRSSEFNGSVKLFFQPAEEGPGGAAPMIAAGVLDNPSVDAIFALHIHTSCPTGHIGLRSGPSHASADSFRIKVTGVGGHGAHPEDGVDALVCGAQLVTALQTLVSREISPLSPAVVTVGTFHAGVRENILADEAILSGTVRVTDRKLRQTMPERLERLVTSVATAFRCTATVDYSFGPPPGFNDAAMIELLRGVATATIGAENVFENPLTLGGEDFACFTERVQGAMFVLGAGNASKGFTYPIHHPNFDFDEDALPYGAALLAGAALTRLAQGN